MTVAIVHDAVIGRGPAERAVLELARSFRHSVVLTAAYAPEATYPEFADLEVFASHRVSESNLARLALLSNPGVFRSFDLSGFELVVVCSSGAAHHIRHPRSVVYWHTLSPGLYDPASAFGRAGMAAGRPYRAMTGSLRRRDAAAVVNHQMHAADSVRTATRLRAVYGIDATVLLPPFEPAVDRAPLTPPPAEPRALVVSRLRAGSRVDRVMAACHEARVPLTIIGDGPDRRRLQRLATGEVSFRGSLDGEDLTRAYEAHTVVLCPAAEDLGYVPAEAAYAGRPVVGVASAGTEGTIIHGVTGLLVDDGDPANWSLALGTALGRSWDQTALRRSVARFRPAAFARRMGEWLSALEAPSVVPVGPGAPTPVRVDPFDALASVQGASDWSFTTTSIARSAR